MCSLLLKGLAVVCFCNHAARTHSAVTSTAVTGSWSAHLQRELLLRELSLNAEGCCCDATSLTGAAGLDDSRAPDEVCRAFPLGFLPRLIRSKESIATAGVNVVSVLIEDLRRGIHDETRRIRRVELATPVDRDVNLLLLTNLLHDLLLGILRS